MCSFMIISKQYTQPLILLTAVFIFLTLKPQKTCVYFSSTFANTLSFSVFQNTSYCETNFLSKQLYFQKFTEIRAASWISYFFANRFFSEHLQILDKIIGAN